MPAMLEGLVLAPRAAPPEGLTPHQLEHPRLWNGADSGWEDLAGGSWQRWGHPELCSQRRLMQAPPPVEGRPGSSVCSRQAFPSDPRSHAHPGWASERPWGMSTGVLPLLRVRGQVPGGWRGPGRTFAQPLLCGQGTARAS